MAPYSAGNLPVVNLSAACCLPDQISSALLVFALLQCGAVLLAAFLLPCYCCRAAAAVCCCCCRLLLQWVVAVASDPSMQPADWQEAFDTLLDNAAQATAA